MGKGKTGCAGATPMNAASMSGTDTFDTFAAASTVAQVMESLEPEQLDEVKGMKTEHASEASIPADRLKPVQRPNGDNYFPRPQGQLGVTDIEYLRFQREDQVNTLLEGEPGCGKTASAEAAFGEELVVVNGSADFQVSDLVGTWVPTGNPDAPYRWQDGPLVVAMREGRPLLVDDITMIDAGVLLRLYPAMESQKKIFLTEHEGEEVVAKDGFVVIGAHNPGAPGAVLSEALRSRFGSSSVVEVDYGIAAELGVPRSIIRAAKKLGNMRKENIINWAPQMREMLDFVRQEKRYGARGAASIMLTGAPDEESKAMLKEALEASFPGLEENVVSGK
jgi:hypothetical protein